LVQPRILLDITGIAELTEIEDRDDAVTLGACITSANIEDGRLPCLIGAPRPRRRGFTLNQAEPWVGIPFGFYLKKIPVIQHKTR
jgi:hypothetical protein